MNPLVALSAMFAVACGAPSHHAGLAIAPAAVGYAAAPAAVGYAAAPAVVPPPIVNEAISGPDTITRAQAPVTQTKQVHYGQTTYVAGYASEILKPAIPRLPIRVPTVLKQDVTVNPAIVKTVNEIHTVNEPVHIDAPYNVPYDVPVPVEKIVEVPYNVHVDAPYNVDVPVPVQGEPIVNVREQTVHRNFHTASASVAAPAVAVAGYAAAPVAHAGYAAAAPIAHAGYAAAAPVAAYNY